MVYQGLRRIPTVLFDRYLLMNVSIQDVWVREKMLFSVIFEDIDGKLCTCVK